MNNLEKVFITDGVRKTDKKHIDKSISTLAFDQPERSPLKESRGYVK